ncbi:MAG: type 1 glutamine amidotransferase [Gammaproteobacteria bacterium]|nr:type 1 glutamine amidotransferase [Gammaproteobacteria bacterium]
MLRIGLSSCFFHPDPQRNIFKGKTLLYMEQSMANWVLRHNALPVLLPPPTSNVPIEKIIDQIDGLLLQGGDDVAPQSYDATALRPEWQGDAIRDRYEIELIKRCARKNRPVLGICRGIQIINVAFGGSLYQDLNTELPKTKVHRNPGLYDKLSHQISINENSRLQTLYDGVTHAMVNSIHHQGIKQLADDFVVEARSAEDGVIEAIRYQPKNNDANNRVQRRHQKAAPYLFGVQWHPEFICDDNNGDNRSLLAAAPIMNDFIAAMTSTTAC